jgi:hypothetical protein
MVKPLVSATLPHIQVDMIFVVSPKIHAILVLAAAQLGGRVSPVLGIRDPLEKVGRGEGTSLLLLVELLHY